MNKKTFIDFYNEINKQIQDHRKMLENNKAQLMEAEVDSELEITLKYQRLALQKVQDKFIKMQLELRQFELDFGEFMDEDE